MKNISDNYQLPIILQLFFLLLKGTEDLFVSLVLVRGPGLCLGVICTFYQRSERDVYINTNTTRQAAGLHSSDDCLM